MVSIDYAECMYRTLTVLILLFALPLYAAEVYKSVDKHGNTVFSDQPSANAEKIEVQDVMTIPALQSEPPKPSVAEPLERYTELTVLTPKNDETYFRSEGDLIISIQTQPALYEGDRVVVYLNSNEFLSGKSLTYNVAELDRGTYQLRVAIKDAADKIVKSSGTITFHMRQTSIQNPQTAKKPAK